MMWTYRVFRDRQGRYSLREVFYDRDKIILDYGKSPVAVVGTSLEETMQLVAWFKEAFDLPVLSVEEVDAKIAARSETKKSDRPQRISLKDAIAQLPVENEPSGTV